MRQRSLGGGVASFPLVHQHDFFNGSFTRWVTQAWISCSRAYSGQRTLDGLVLLWEKKEAKIPPSGVGLNVNVIYVCKYLQNINTGQLTAVSDGDAVQMVVNPVACGHLGSQGFMQCLMAEGRGSNMHDTTK